MGIDELVFGRLWGAIVRDGCVHCHVYDEPVERFKLSNVSVEDEERVHAAAASQDSRSDGACAKGCRAG